MSSSSRPCTGRPLTIAGIRARILEDMGRRVGALVVSLMAAGAPVATAACEMACASRSTNITAHSCHDTRQGTETPVNGVPHCAHTADLPASSARVPSQSAPAPAIAASTSTPPEYLEHAWLRRFAFSPLPPGPLKRTSQLRV